MEASRNALTFTNDLPLMCRMENTIYKINKFMFHHVQKLNIILIYIYTKTLTCQKEYGLITPTSGPFYPLKILITIFIILNFCVTVD